MGRRCGVRLGVSVIVALAVGVFPLLPPEHLHLAGVEGRTTAIIHAHQVQIVDYVPSEPSLIPPHGSHGRAIFLTTVFNSDGQGPSRPVLPLVGSVVAVPQFQFIGVVQAVLIPDAHGPPGVTWLTRGPPSVSFC